MTLDTEKAFDQVNHLFLITALEKYGFKEDFIKWMQILIKNQESCVINGGTTNYFKLERNTRHGDPVSAYLFILVLEIAFLFILQNRNIKGLHIFENTILHIAQANNTTFFLKDEKSVIELMKTFDIFSTFSGLKPNESKFEIADLGALKGVSQHSVEWNVLIWYSIQLKFQESITPVHNGPSTEGPLSICALYCTSLVHIFSIFHYFHVVLSSCSTIFVLHSYFVALWSRCILSMLHFFNVVIFRDFFHLVLFSCFIVLRVALFSCCTHFELYFFRVALFSYCTPFSCCTFFILHFFRVAFFSYCAFFLLHSFDLGAFFVMHRSTSFVFYLFRVVSCCLKT